MASKGGNPFLMDDYSAEPESAQQASNPFLQDFVDPTASTGGSGENPFLNFSAEQTTYQPPTTDSTNPFAFFGVETTEEKQYPAGDDAAGSFVPPEGNFFGLEETQPTEPAIQLDLFDTSDDPQTDVIQPEPVQIFGESQEPEKPAAPGAATIPTKSKPTPSRPPPPPRPHPPLPPKNTKDLILSVTGALDATSNHLLDRLQATRTPSPTLMHSPSPTPEHSFADLLDVDGNIPDLIPDDSAQMVTTKNQDIMDLFDVPNNESTPMFSGSNVGLDTSTQLVSSTDTTFATGITDTTAKIQENPFDIAEEPIATVEVEEEDATSGDDTFLSGSEEKRLSKDSAITPFSVAETIDASSVPVQPISTDFEVTQQASSIPISEESVEPPTADANFFSVAETTPTATSAASTEVISDETTFTSTAPVGIFNAEPLFSTGGDSTPPIPTDNATNVFASDLLGDFSRPTENVNDFVSTSPVSGAEFPISESHAHDDLDNFAATTRAIESTGDAFDAFATKFDKAGEPEAPNDPFFDAFGSGQVAMDTSSDVWGDSSVAGSDNAASGFGENEGFDTFLSMTAPPQQEPKLQRTDSGDSDDGPDFSVFIKPKEGDQASGLEGGPVPVLAPPPKSPQISAYNDSSPRFNPFDKSAGFGQEAVLPMEGAQTGEMTRTDSQETPPTPLFDEDVSQPLEEFPRSTYTGDGWEMQLRQPNKKKITGQRFWKKIFVRLVYQADTPILQLFNSKDDKDAFQELPLMACYAVSEISAQQFDQYGKIFTVKVQYIFYKKRPGVRPGQVTSAERLTNKLSQFAAYAIQGDYQGVKEFGSDLKKLGLPVEHAPQISQLFKLGSQQYEDMKQFSCAIEEALFRLASHRDRAPNHKLEEVQISVVDEVYIEQNADGHVEKQIARVRLFFLGFLSGMPDVELGINDMWRQGKEVVGRHDIIPVVTEEWIRLENVEFHSCVQQDEYENSRIIKFKPPDGQYIELMRFRVRPPKNRELPLQLKAVMCVTGNKVELRADILVPGFTSRKLGQVPCEDVVVRFPIPECWIYLFRVEKHFRYGSVKSAHRRTGKIKGIERLFGAVDTLEPQLMEVTSGQAKYEHQHRAIVWRMPRLPKEGQGAYTTHGLVCRMALTSYDQIPENLAEYAYIEFTMPATQVSHTTARSVSLQNSDSDAPPEKYVRNLSRHEYRVGIEHTQGEGPNAYVAATKKIPEVVPETPPQQQIPEDSDSDGSD